MTTHTKICAFCEAILFQEEPSSVCCRNGNNLLSADEVSVPGAFIDFFNRHETILSGPYARHVNSYASLSSVGVCSQLTDNHAVMDVSQDFFLQSHGRIYHHAVAFDPVATTTSLDVMLLPSSFLVVDLQERVDATYFDFVPPSIQAPLRQAIFDLRNLLCRHNIYYVNLLEAAALCTGHLPTVSPNFGLHSRVEVLVALYQLPSSTDQHRQCVRFTENGTGFRASTYSQQYERFAYPLLFPTAIGGWHPGKRWFTLTDQSDQQINIRDYSKAMLYQSRIFAKCPRVMQEWALDQYFRFLYHEADFHCSQLRSATRNEIESSEEELSKCGISFHIRSSFPGSPGYRETHVRKGLAHVTAVGFPHVFVTHTFNTDDNLILRSLLGNDTPWYQRPDVCARQYVLELLDLLRDFRSGHSFGYQAEYIQYVVEFQMRGKPHAHFLIRFKGIEELTPEIVDSIICAEIPAPCANANCPAFPSCTRCKMRYAVSTMMTHECVPERCFKPPRGDPDQRLCKYGFPFKENPTTHIGFDGQWLLRRKATDQHVVAYNPALLLKFWSHINVLPMSTVIGVKYTRKYFCKPLHKVAVALQGAGSPRECYDKFFEFFSVCACEAVWHLLKEPFYYYEPTVKLLSVHFEGKDTITFSPETAIDDILARNSDLMTYLHRPLEISFDSVLFVDYFSNFSVTSSPGPWADQDSRYVHIRPLSHRPVVVVATVSPRNIEIFALRRLVIHKPFRSFAELRAGHTTFVEAAKIAGFLHSADDFAWDLFINDQVADAATPPEVRDSFVQLLLHGSASVQAIFHNYWQYMYDAFRHRLADIAEQPFAVLQDISLLLNKEGKSLIDFEERLPIVKDFLSSRFAVSTPALVNDFFKEITSRATAFLRCPLHSSQQDVFHAVVNNIVPYVTASPERSPHQQLLAYVNGSAGTGKTFLLNSIIAAVAPHKNIVASAHTGVAAGELLYGLTLCALLKIPVDEDEQAASQVDVKNYLSRRCHLWHIIKHAQLFVVDEASQIHQDYLSILDITLQEIHENQLPFGGCDLLLAGDFKQCCPIVKYCPVNTLESATLKASILTHKRWPLFSFFALDTPVRQASDDRFHAFCSNIGKGLSSPKASHYVDLPDYITKYRTDGDLITAWNSTPQAVLISFHHDRVNYFNKLRFDAFAGTAMSFPASYYNQDDGRKTKLIETQACEKCVQNNVPPHELLLKVGVPVICLRNIQVSKGIANGTFMEVLGISSSRLKLKVTTGPCKDKHIEMFAIPFRLTKLTGITVYRVQFPITLAFAITANRSQAKTLGSGFVDLKNQSFCHGQTYVAFTRFPTSACFAVRTNDERTNQVHNVVFHSILDKLGH